MRALVGRGVFLPMVAVSALLAASVGEASAVYDLSGRWGVKIHIAAAELRYWDVEQSGTQITVTVEQPYGTYSGKIDDSTGAFELPSFESSVVCGLDSITGSVAADSRTFSGTYLDNYFCGSLQNPSCCSRQLTISGSRCGNELLDDGEQCDDGNWTAGDCCSPGCTFDAEGAACPDDSNGCTDDVCDGAGECVHPDNVAPCGDQCGSGTCVSGSCEITAPEPEGTSCSGDHSLCTLDTCDGAGECVNSGALLDCAPCGACDAALGCVPAIHACQRPTTTSLSVRLDEDNGRKLSLTIKDGIPFEDLGDPTLTTDYTLCLYAQNGSSTPPLIFQATLPAAGQCGDDACWSAHGDESYRYRDKLLATAGIGSVRLGTKGITIKGRRSSLPLPAAFPGGSFSLTPKFVAVDETGTRCWGALLQTDIYTSDRYKGRQ